uniref:Pollen-specific leucine-rich repeat extensin-like protein 2 isoform X1 n=1 Tax=Elaeis guineensis var. tenera TaxID=51953 RepID=A0A8N4F285_ELAGV|nr:pollen-specific leucine-rich repeat extensin-like protein 2 isoform X1 [Elaeis guineensis]
MATMGGRSGKDDPTKISVEQPPCYGTFPPPPPPSPSAPLPPQSRYPPPLVYHHNPPATYHAIPVGYQTQPYQALVDGIPMTMREPPLPICGIGIGWALSHNRELRREGNRPPTIAEDRATESLKNPNPVFLSGKDPMQQGNIKDVPDHGYTGNKETSVDGRS